MDQEIRFRIPNVLHAAITDAARNRGVPVTSLMAIMAYEYLHTRNELVSAPAAPAKPTPAPEPEPLVEIINAFDDDDDEWTEEELAYWRAKGRAISTS